MRMFGTQIIGPILQPSLHRLVLRKQAIGVKSVIMLERLLHITVLYQQSGIPWLPSVCT